MRLIDADKAKNSSDNKHDVTNFFTDYKTIDDVRRFLDLQPTIEAQSVVHAHWDFFCAQNIICPICKKHFKEMSNYCPNCGAKMDI